jgi:hypothetical protein
MSLDTIRRDTAEYIAQNYDFSYEVVDSTGWSTTDPGTEWTKTFYFADPDTRSAPSIPGTFTVRFEGPESYVPVEAFANVRGEIVGNIMGGELTDYIVNDETVSAPRM